MRWLIRPFIYSIIRCHRERSGATEDNVADVDGNVSAKKNRTIDVNDSLDDAHAHDNALKRKMKPVEQISLVTGQVERVFPSAAMAARHYNVNGLQQRISLCCTGKLQHTFGSRWRFAGTTSDPMPPNSHLQCHSLVSSSAGMGSSSLGVCVSKDRQCMCTSRWSCGKSLFVLCLEAVQVCFWRETRRGIRWSTISRVCCVLCVTIATYSMCIEYMVCVCVWYDDVRSFDGLFSLTHSLVFVFVCC